MATDLTHWRRTDNGATLTYAHISGKVTITQQKGVKGRDGTKMDDRRKDGKPEIPQAAWTELIDDIRRYD